nr:toll/interleukin-1 receptor domain-containing protein [Rhizobium mongolense]
MFRGHLQGLLQEDPKIFVDSAQPTGVQWPQNIRDALLRSRVMVAVWTPPYFKSDWCMAEWESMLQREAFLKTQGKAHPNGLVYPVVFSDGRNFDPRAQNTQSRDLSNMNYPWEAFRDSPKYLDFHDEVKAIADEVEERIAQAPQWDSLFPLADPSAVIVNNPQIGLPLL